MMVSTFWGLTVPEDQKEDIRIVNGEVVNFNYTEVVPDYYRHRGALDNKNALMHHGGTKYQFGFKSKWGTTWWPIQVLLF